MAGLGVLDGARASAWLAPLGMARALTFEAGRLLSLLILLALAVPLIRLVSRRPALHRRAIIGACCLTLAALGFSLVQTLRLS